MGAYCSHEDLHVYNIDPKQYKSLDNIWMIRPADARCNSCGDVLRAVQKTCCDHYIQQPFEVIDKHNCKHDRIEITNQHRSKEKSDENRFDARAMCMICSISAPVYATYMKNGNNNILTSEWMVDKKQLNREKVS